MKARTKNFQIERRAAKSLKRLRLRREVRSGSNRKIVIETVLFTSLSLGFFEEISRITGFTCAEFTIKLLGKLWDMIPVFISFLHAHFLN